MQHGSSLASPDEEHNASANIPRPKFALRPRQWIFLSLIGLALLLDVVFFTGIYGSDDKGYLGAAYDLVQRLATSYRYLNDGAGSRLGVVLPATVTMALSGGDAQATAASFIAFHFLMMLAVYLLGKRCHNERVGLIAAGLLAFHPTLVVYAGCALPDIPATVYMLFSLYAVLLATRFTRPEVRPETKDRKGPAAEQPSSSPTTAGRTGPSPRHQLWRRFVGMLPAYLGGALLGMAYTAKESWVFYIPVLTAIVFFIPPRRTLFNRCLSVFYLGLGFLTILLLESAILSWMYGHFRFRLRERYVADPSDLILYTSRQGGNNPVARAKFLFGILKGDMGYFAPLFLFSLILYPLLPRRSWPLWLSLAWMFSYHTWGSASFTKYIPILMNVRYYTFIVPLGALCLAALVDWTLRPNPLASSRPLRYAVIAVYSCACIFLFSFTIQFANSVAGRIYCAAETGALNQALDFALTNYPKTPIVVSNYLSDNHAPLFFAGKSDRIMLLPKNALAWKLAQEKLGQGKFIYLYSKYERDRHLVAIDSYKKNRKQIEAKSIVDIDAEIVLAANGEKSLCSDRNVATFYQYYRRLDALLWRNNWRAGVPRPIDISRSIFLDEASLSPQSESFLSGWVEYSSYGLNTDVVHVNDGIQFEFPVKNPVQGDHIGVAKLFKTDPGKRFVIKAAIYDPYAPGGLPGRWEQQIFIGDQLVWRYDLAKDPFQGFLQVKVPFIATANPTLVKCETRAVGSIEKWTWGPQINVKIGSFEVIPEP